MKVFAICDKSDYGKKVIGYLKFYEKSNAFIIELCSGLTEWEVPVFFSEYVRKGLYTIPGNISMLWVKERVIPSGRQNIGIILRNHKMNEYNEMKMLLASKGKCSQDECYIREIKYDDLPEEIRMREGNCVTECFVSEDDCIICLFADNSVRRVNLNALLNRYAKLYHVMQNRKLLETVRTSVGGYSIVFDSAVEVNASTLIEKGELLPLAAGDFKRFATKNLVDTAEDCELIDCKKKNVAYLTKKERLQPIKPGLKENIFYRGDVEKNVWD